MWQRAIRTTKHSHFLFLYTSINLRVFDLTPVFPVAFSCKCKYVLFLLCFLGFIIRHQQVFLSEIHLVRSQSLYSTAESFVVSESSSIPWHLMAFFKDKVPLMFTGKHTAYVWINRSRQYGSKTFQFAFSHVCFQKKYLTQTATSIKWKLRLEK